MPTSREPIATQLTGTGPVRVAFWHQDAAAAAGAEPAEWLAPEERPEYESLVTEKRRREWFAARVALKSILVAEGLVRRPTEATVRKDALGAPRIAIWEPDTLRYAEIACAISHCAPYVLCACLPGRGARLGVDVERRTWRLSRLGRKFVSENDAMLPKDDENGDQTVLWSIKESLSKLLGTGWACGFRNLACVETEPGRCVLKDAEGLQHQGLYRWFGQYVLTLAYDLPQPRESAPAAEKKGGARGGPFAAAARVLERSRRRAALRRRRRSRAQLPDGAPIAAAGAASDVGAPDAATTSPPSPSDLRPPTFPEPESAASDSVAT